MKVRGRHQALAPPGAAGSSDPGRTPGGWRNLFGATKG
jgi:hypothetical protein